MRRLALAFCILCVSLSEQRSTPQDDHYVAAVVEYAVRRDTEQNLNNYVSLIAEAAAQDADIVVFPEMTLTAGHSVPVPIHGLLKDYPIPALDPTLYDEILVALSSSARQHGIYVVVNVEEVMNCTEAHAPEEYCPTEEVYRFNTNVVFDRNGAVIDRYRKINLFGEFTRTPALRPELGVFETDFGVRFGHFVCFDLMFQVPAVQVVQQMQVTDVVFTTMWFSEIPYLSAVQIQEAYAYTEQVNFLAAGANNVAVGSAGSGIYSGSAGALISIMPGSNTTRVLVATVPKVPGSVVPGSFPGPEYDPPSAQDNLFLLTDPSVPAHVTRILVPGHQEFELVHNEVTCRFRVKLSPRNVTQEYVYRASAFDGVRTFGGFETGGVRACTVIACTNQTIESCGTRFEEYAQDNTPTFEELFISCETPPPSLNMTTISMDSTYYPVSLEVSTMPLKLTDFELIYLRGLNEMGYYNMTLVNSNVDLLSFGVWGRFYPKDGDEPTGSKSAELISLNLLLLFVVFLYVYNINYMD